MRRSLLAAALAPAPILVTIGGRSWEIPPLPAEDWIRALMSGQVEAAVVPGLLADADAADVLDTALGGRLDETAWRRAVYGAISDAAGRDWWQAIRLVNAVDGDGLGRTYGELVLRGVDPWRVSLGAWCAAVYALLARNLDEKGLARLNTKLMLVPEVADEYLGDAPSDAEQLAELLKVMPQFGPG